MRKQWGACLAVGLLFLAAAGARADELHSVRVSDVRGDLAVRGETDSDVSYVGINGIVRDGDSLWTDQNGRAELELENGSFLRLAEDTKIEAKDIDRNPEFRIWNGSLYVDRPEQSRSEVRVATPAGDVEVSAASLVRVDLDGERVRVTVYHGGAKVVPTHGRAVEVAARQRAVLDSERGVEGPDRYEDQADNFDEYEQARFHYFEDRPEPAEAEGGGIVGVRDLEGHGEWVMNDGARYWRPHVAADWRPYTDGYWSFVPAVGYTWIDRSPWGYTTHHYGRWSYTPAYGWLWLPAREWGPAYVHWASYRNYCGWAPLDPFDRPVSYAGVGIGLGVSFRIGGVAVGLGAFSFCERDSFLYSRSGVILAGGGHPYHTAREVNITNITINNFHSVDHIRSFVGVPEHPVRGMLFNSRGVAARTRVLDVERRIPARRQEMIHERFRVAANRDVVRARQASVVEGIQRNPRSAIPANQIAHGRAADRLAGPARERTSRSPGETRGLKPVSGIPSGPATGTRPLGSVRDGTGTGRNRNEPGGAGANRRGGSASGGFGLGGFRKSSKGAHGAIPSEAREKKKTDGGKAIPSNSR